MNILFYVPGMPFNGNTIPSGQSLGGSESAGYYMAKALVKRGHKVTVYTGSQECGRWDGVKYEWIGPVSEQFPLGERYQFATRTPYDVIISQRHPASFLFPTASKMNIWWLHDLAIHRLFSQVQPHLVNTDRIFTVSEFHRQQVAKIYDVDPDHITATWNGLDYSFYEDIDKDTEREPKSLIFASRPERGLANLVGEGGIMEKLPDYKLYVCCYNNTTSEMAPFYNMLWERCEKLPNVVNLGHLGKHELAERMAKVQAYAYPTDFEDTSCMIALEANAVGTPFISLHNAALPETMKGAGAVLLPFEGFTPDKFIKTVKNVCTDKKRWTDLHQKALGKRQTWDSAAEQWEQVIEDIFREKTGDTYRLYEHLENMSDIVALKKHAQEYGLEIPDKIKQNYDFYLRGNGDFSAHYKAYYEYEKNRGVNYGPESLIGQPRYEIIKQTVSEAQPKTLLDYGCAHGHYINNLAPALPYIKYTGIDIEQSNVDKANAWAKALNIATDIEFRQGSLKAGIKGNYDFILMCEVLEHMEDPRGAVEQMLSHLNDGGTMCISVPYGPWEAIGYHEHKGWRAHIHHLEQADLYDMFGGQKNVQVISIPHQNMMGFGQYLVTFKKDQNNPALGEISYSRKLLEQSPIETLSVCMIAKDEAVNIAKCLSKLRYVADEVVIGIDDTCTDNTAEIAIGMLSQYGIKHKVFRIESPLKQGFAEARNRTIEKASMDWIMWIDCDETLERSENLQKYLKHNVYDGYAIRQHHISAEPPGVHKLDYPCRLFRNNGSVKFFGVVHEHPSKAEDMNKGVGKVIVLPDVDIMHQGYTTEKIRKGRFERNIGLMARDREVNPERKLGKFLWLRDLINLTHTSLQMTGGQITPQDITRCNQAIDMFRELVRSKDIRLAIEATLWYSEAVKILTSGNALETVIYCDIVKGNGSNILPKPIDPNNVVKCCFLNKKDLADFQNMLLDAKTENYDSKYF